MLQLQIRMKLTVRMLPVIIILLIILKTMTIMLIIGMMMMMTMMNNQWNMLNVISPERSDGHE